MEIFFQFGKMMIKRIFKMPLNQQNGAFFRLKFTATAHLAYNGASQRWRKTVKPLYFKSFGQKGALTFSFSS